MVDAMGSMLATLVNAPQNPHNDYLLASEADEGDELTIIMGLTCNITFLIVWRPGDPTPIIIWIPYGFGLLFQKEMIHAGGLGLSESLVSVMDDPTLGCPRLHLYLVRNKDGIPKDFICYGDPNNIGRSYNKSLYTPHPSDALRICKILIAQNEYRQQKKSKMKSKPRGLFPGGF